MQMEELRKQWITSEKEYREGEVFVYRQKFTASQVKKAMFYGTALGVYEAELNGVCSIRHTRLRSCCGKGKIR